ncbi:unnamed protein product [Caretta caretta]
MAALERPVPSPEAFLGQPWAAWVREAAPSHAYCAALPHSVDLEETGKEGGKSREVMRLNKEGFCPDLACNIEALLGIKYWLTLVLAA